MESITITVEELARELDFEILISGRGKIELRYFEINRPGLQFTGYYEEFAERRVQLVGNAEVHYLYDLDDAALRVCADRFYPPAYPAWCLPAISSRPSFF